MNISMGPSMYYVIIILGFLFCDYVIHTWMVPIQYCIFQFSFLLAFFSANSKVFLDSCDRKIPITYKKGSVFSTYSYQGFNASIFRNIFKFWQHQNCVAFIFRHKNKSEINKYLTTLCLFQMKIGLLMIDR